MASPKIYAPTQRQTILSARTSGYFSMSEMEGAALRLQNEALKEENARLKATRAAIYKMYIESQGKSSSRVFFTRQRVFEALQLSADADRDKKEPAPRSSRRSLPRR